MINKTFEELLKGYIENDLTKVELGDFLQLIKQDRYKSSLQKSIDQLLAKESNEIFAGENISNDIFNKIINEGINKNTNDTATLYQLDQTKKVYKLLKIAAAVLLLLSTSLYFYFNKKTDAIIVETASKLLPKKNNILPTGNKATLLLADGSTISLDDAKNGAISKQGNTNLINNNGRLTYNPSSLISDQILYNTILTSNGGQYQIELSDGTKVWLNAASSIYFPTSFKGKQRKVSITGEAYFEVAENKKMPFIVTANGAEIQVLGTHFNVMAYLDEPTFKTTLLEGKVKFVNGNTEGILIPGQQLQLTKTGQFKVLNNVNLNGVIAWKNGLFHFENAEIETVIKQVSRWYDVEIICADNNKRVAQNKNTAELMYADIPRSTKLEDVLKALEIASGAKFIIGNKQLMRKNCTTEKLKL